MALSSLDSTSNPLYGRETTEPTCPNSVVAKILLALSTLPGKQTLYLHGTEDCQEQQA